MSKLKQPFIEDMELHGYGKRPLLLKAKIHEEGIPESHSFTCPTCGRVMVLVRTTRRRIAPRLTDLIPQITNIAGIVHQSKIPVGI